MKPFSREALALLRHQAQDPALNPLGLSWSLIYHRVQALGWTVKKAFDTPQMSRSDAARIAAKNPYWRNFTLKTGSKNGV
jgi:hypothetical protein